MKKGKSLNKKELATHFGRFLAQKLLVIQVEEFAVRGVVLEQSGGRITTRAWGEVEFDSSGASLRVKIAKLLELKKSLPELAHAKSVALISEEVHCFPVWLPQEIKKRPLTASQMVTFARSESAGFLEGSPLNYHISAIWVEPTIEEDLPLAGGEPLKREALVCAVQSGLYRGLSGILKGFGKNLVALYPPEVVGWSICGQTVASRGEHCIVEWRPYEVLGVLVSSGMVRRTVRQPLQAGEDVSGAISSLVADIVDDPADLEEAVIGGAMAEKAEWLTTDHSALNLRLKRWNLPDELPHVSASSAIPLRYMAALGAGVNYWGPRESRIFCNDKQTFAAFLKTNVHALPVAILLLLLLGIGGEYLHLSSKTEKLKERIEVLREEERDLNRKIDAKRRLDRTLREKEGERERLLDEMNLLRGEIPIALRAKRDLYEDIVFATPPEIQLTLIEQFSDEVFFVEAQTLSINAVQTFPVILRDMQAVQEVRLEKSGERLSGDGRSTPRQRWYTARVRLRVRRGGDLS